MGVPSFNSGSPVTVIDFSAFLSNVLASKKLSRRISGAELREVYSDTQGQYTLAYSKWSRSGKNAPTNFSDCCMRASSHGQLSLAGKRSVIMFVMYRCGTAFEVEDIMYFTLKSVPTA